VVMISPDAAPPVVRLIEVSKLKYEQEKAKKEAGRKSRAARCAFGTPPPCGFLPTKEPWSSGCAARPRPSKLVSAELAGAWHR
jgi:Translation initiation factor IF-3, N-terminal domain